MGTGKPGDKEKTIEQLQSPKREVGKFTWLRHRTKSQSGMIDLMLLEGRYTVEEMAARLQSYFPDRAFAMLCKRVRDHIDHLGDGDKRDHSLHRKDNHKPHKLKVEKNNRCSFNKTQ
jgi:hypothetical protein